MSIIIPVRNEASIIGPALVALQTLRSEGVQVIVVDGHSTDGTVSRCTGLCDVLLHSEPSRARQMNRGATQALGTVLLFLHADTQLPPNVLSVVLPALALRADGAVRARWGRFDVNIDGKPALLRVVAALMNWRSRATGIATGDQALFIRRDEFIAVGGYPNQPLMEDVEISKRLRARSAPVSLLERVTTSGRRWEQRGVWRTVFLMWRLRFYYWLGASPTKLAQMYA